MKKRDLVSDKNLSSKILVSPKLASNGLALPMILTYLLNRVWVLSSNVLPQPNGTVGIWIDSETWADSNVWYD